MAIPGNVGAKKSTFSSPAAMAQAQRAAEAQSMKALQDRREQTRKDFFKGRQDISNNRLDRRQIQKDLYEKFKQEQMKPVGNTGFIDPETGKLTGALYQSRTPGGPTLADEAMRLANLYGPTFREIGSDMGYAIGSMGKGLGEFIGKGGVIGNVLSGLYDKFKGGTQQGIETVKDLYDNLRTTFSGQPTVTTGGSSSIMTTSEGQPAINLIPASIDTEELPAMNLSRNVGDESDPSIFGIDNAGVSLPYERSTVENPNLINALPQGGGYLPEGYSNVGVAPIVPEYYDPNNTLGNIYLESIGVVPEGTINSDLRTEISPEDKRRMLDQYIFDKMIREEINRNKQQKINRDMQMYQTDPTGRPVLLAENVGLPSLMDLYDFARNPEVNTSVGNLRFDNVLSGNPQLGYSNTVDIFGQPVDVRATIGDQGLNIGGSFTFKDGGSVDKYAGLGYKLK